MNGDPLTRLLALRTTSPRRVVGLISGTKENNIVRLWRCHGDSEGLEQDGAASVMKSRKRWHMEWRCWSRSTRQTLVTR